MASPGSGDEDGTAAVCCMCGDHGMPQELFRCKVCRHRSQHRYCSELYPRETAYRRCNWCLREEGGGGSPVRTTAKRKMSTSSERSSSGCSRSAFSAEPGKPVKKPNIGHGRGVLPAPEVLTTNMSRKSQAAAKKPRFRVKARRYKLLAEVISC